MLTVPLQPSAFTWIDTVSSSSLIWLNALLAQWLLSASMWLLSAAISAPSCTPRRALRACGTGVNYRRYLWPGLALYLVSGAWGWAWPRLAARLGLSARFFSPAGPARREREPHTQYFCRTVARCL